MSDPIRHECGLAVVRLLKPLGYYEHKYGSALWGLDKLHALMIKQRNRGQDGMGIGCCKLKMEPGQPYMFRLRSSKTNSLEEVFGEVTDEFKDVDTKAAESKLKGHIKGADESDEGSGSSAYVPADPKDDLQLAAALKLLRGEDKNPAFPPDPTKAQPN